MFPAIATCIISFLETLIYDISEEEKNEKG